MVGTCKARVPMAEQIRFINECRQSGMTDADWCCENDIAVSTFYNWVNRCQKAFIWRLQSIVSKTTMSQTSPDKWLCHIIIIR